MNKTPQQCWDRIKGITSTYEMGAHCKLGNDPYYEVEVKTIEKALIENATLNYLLRGVTYTFEKEDFTLEQLGKKLKALEIIKKKTNLTKTNDDKKALVFVILENQEDFDLLKEVLK